MARSPSNWSYIKHLDNVAEALNQATLKRLLPVENKMSHDNSKRTNKTQQLTRYGNLGGLYSSPRGIQYFAWFQRMSEGGFPGTQSNQDRLRPIDVRTMRLKFIQAALVATAEALENKIVTQEIAEAVLDHLYAELNRRLNKVAK